MPSQKPSSARTLFRLAARMGRPCCTAMVAAWILWGCGTGSISFPNMSSGQNNSSGNSAPTGTSPATTQAAGLLVGFEYTPGSASAKLHPIADTAYWMQDLTAIQALATGSQPAARLAVVTTTDAGVLVNFPSTNSNTPQGLSPANGVTFSASDAYDAILTSLDAQRANVILEIQPLQVSPVSLAQEVLTHYAPHASVVGISVDLRYYGKKVGKTKMPDALATQLVQAVTAISPTLQTQVRHTSSAYMPSAQVAGLTFVYDTSTNTGEAALVTSSRQWVQDFSPNKVGFVIGDANTQPWACQLVLGPSQLIGDVASSGNTVTNIFWSADTAALLSPTNTYSCANPNNPNTTTPTDGNQPVDANSTTPSPTPSPNATTEPTPVTEPSSDPNTQQAPSGGGGFPF